MSAAENVTTLCGTPEIVTNVEVSGVNSGGMTFSWDPPVNYNGDSNNPQYQVSILT